MVQCLQLNKNFGSLKPSLTLKIKVKVTNIFQYMWDIKMINKQFKLEDKILNAYIFKKLKPNFWRFLGQFDLEDQVWHNTGSQILPVTDLCQSFSSGRQQNFNLYLNVSNLF